MSNSVLIFTIGPVQGFIKEARRAHDLWAGSQILVQVTREAALVVARTPGAEVIFPAKELLESAARSLPNRFVALVPAERAAEIADAAEAKTRKIWDSYAARAHDRLRTLGPADQEWEDIWKRQIPHYLEVYWAACDPPSAEQIERFALKAGTAYGTWYSWVAMALGQRKRTRQFAPAGKHGEDGPKDTLSGARSALRTQTHDPKSYWSAIAASLESRNVPTLLRSDGKERLDAIGAMKRFAPLSDDWKEKENERFPSVSSVAAADFRRKVKAKSAQKLLDAHAHALGDLGIFPPQNAFKCDDLAPFEFDGDTLYMERLTAKTLEDDYHLRSVDQKKLDAAHGTLKRLYDAVGARPSAYYAILAMDGDRMGARVSSCQSKEKHRELSESLAHFAEQATRIVEKDYAGRVVYAGGDDLLAFLPQADALPAARMIRSAFVSIVKDATISAGIALAHHQAPLDAALDAAREAEEIAKRDYGRDALCVIALKRSGEHIRVGAKWEHKQDTVQLLTRVRDRFADDALASKFAYDVFQEARALEKLPDAHAAALRRLVKRHTDARKLGEAAALEMAEDLALLAQDLNEGAPDDPAQGERQHGTVELASWIMVMRFLAQGGED